MSVLSFASCRYSIEPASRVAPGFASARLPSTVGDAGGAVPHFFLIKVHSFTSSGALPSEVPGGRARRWCQCYSRAKQAFELRFVEPPVGRRLVRETRDRLSIVQHVGEFPAGERRLDVD